MKRISVDAMTENRAGILLWLLIFAIPAVAGGAGPYEINWYTVDGGGGSSGSGPYTLTGTIGQPDAGWMSGGDYELLGGFWPGGPLCFVEFEDFARFAEHWLKSGTGLPGDLNADYDVDYLDLRLFIEEWLATCPHNWPLK